MRARAVIGVAAALVAGAAGPVDPGAAQEVCGKGPTGATGATGPVVPRVAAKAAVLCPDLEFAPGSGGFEAESERTIRVFATVRNAGDAPSAPTVAVVTAPWHDVDEPAAREVRVGELAPGAEAPITATFTAPPGAPP